MAQAAWRAGVIGRATFSLFFRGYPPDRAFYAVAGIESALSHLDSLQFTEDDIGFLESTGTFDPSFLETLRSLSFTGAARAVREGTVVFADEPVLEITAPYIEAQIVETALLNAITFQTTALTKAVRIRQAAGDRPVVEFGARRAHGIDAADNAARCAWIAGFEGTSNLSAAAKYGVPAVGTMAHSFIQAFPDELSAFRAYAQEFPDSTTLLVDTYDTLDGVANAIEVGREMEQRGERLRAIRLDSGELGSLAKQARKMLDDAGLEYVWIVASGGLDEHSIALLVAEGAPIDSFGVGTRFIVSADAPYADSVYKLVSYEGRESRKLSPGKETQPGPKQVFRTVENGALISDQIGAEDEETPPGAVSLLEKRMEAGRRIDPAEDLDAIRERMASQLALLKPGMLRLREPENMPVGVTDRLRNALTEGA